MNTPTTTMGNYCNVYTGFAIKISPETMGKLMMRWLEDVYAMLSDEQKAIIHPDDAYAIETAAESLFASTVDSGNDWAVSETHSSVYARYFYGPSSPASSMLLWLLEPDVHEGVFKGYATGPTIAKLFHQPRESGQISMRVENEDRLVSDALDRLATIGFNRDYAQQLIGSVRPDFYTLFYDPSG